MVHAFKSGSRATGWGGRFRGGCRAGLAVLAAVLATGAGGMLAGCSAGSRSFAPESTVASAFRHVVMHQSPEHFGPTDAGWLEPTAADWPVLPAGSGPMTHCYQSQPLEAGLRFDEALVSWNLGVPAGAAAVVEIRVAEAGEGAAWSPWMFVGDWSGNRPGAGGITTIVSPVVKFAGGKIDVDYLVAAKGKTFGQLQYRVLVFSAVATQDASPVSIARMTVCCMDTAAADAHWARQDALRLGTPRPGVPVGTDRAAAAAKAADPARVEVAVPLRSQKTERPEIAGRICSPTSVTMVLGAYGIERPVLEIAEAAFDARHDLYGNWPRNVQTAYSRGVPGYLTRLTSWREVEDLLNLGWPVIISIQTKPGELRGAPYKETDGHLIVIRGIDAAGNILVNDPAASEPEKAALTYYRDDLTAVWLKRTLGTAYVLQRPIRW
jgi:hypothetical protein